MIALTLCLFGGRRLAHSVVTERPDLSSVSSALRVMVLRFLSGSAAMDINELLLACRRGDLEKVRYLVEKKEVPLCIRDKWDSTPLYYACYCGHKEIVQYLLANGAKCEANTFDGERCIYGALTDEIRNLLRSFKVVTSRIMRRHTYDEFLRKMYETVEFTDVLVTTRDGKSRRCHKCILAARSEYFRKVFSQDPNLREVRLDFQSSELFESLKEYMYTGTMRMLLEEDKVLEVQKMAEQFLLTSFIDKLLDELDKYECERSRYIKQVHHIIIEPELDSAELSESFGKLADEYLRKDLIELPFGSTKARSIMYADVCFQVEGTRFFAHRLFYCQRSEYFSAHLRDHFREAATVNGDIPLISLSDITADVFSCIHEFIYKDYTENLTATNVFDVLFAADMFLLNGLKRYCGNYVGERIDTDNAVSLLKNARMFELARLEDQCVAFISNRLEHFVDDVEFHELVIEDAKQVKERQETDSIAIIDDIRYHISANVQTFAEIEDANEKLFLIDQFLFRLNLEA
ncbi:ankyrin repeat and BTB/POZ domain-containing protein 1 [Galendromus occidentalis]|uniref:Ankyrin repeat and BTB/POZ domain-containing protein 1 n=1 Tax=Galendromus occidentalis TaxID=34638 RepID=A0AAJ6QQI8_9ACAR|nr:ankyrin repeat and BTB/POZ domain-containing protein 1 [Galendromus occidentalis]